MKKSLNNSLNRGTVIFIVLIFIIIVTSMVLITSLKMSSEFEFIENETNKLNSYTSVVSGYNFALNRILTSIKTRAELLDITNKPYKTRLILDGSNININVLDLIKDEYREKINFNTSCLSDMNIQIELQDSAGLINFFLIDRGLLKNFFRSYGIDNDKAEIIIDSISDWMDSDDFTRLAGAERAYYLNKFGYVPSNHMIFSKDELQLIRGVNKKIYADINEWLDFSVRNHGLNPNTMPREVFRLFFGLSDDSIGNIIMKRKEKEIESLSGFTLMSGFNFSVYPKAFQFFTSNTTYVKIKSKMGKNRYFYIMTKIGKDRGRQRMMGGDRGRGGLFGRSLLGADLSSVCNISYLEEGTEEVSNE